MWEYEHSIDTEASPEAIYRLWSDVAMWPGWDDGIAEVTLDGPLRGRGTRCLNAEGAGATGVPRHRGAAERGLRRRDGDAGGGARAALCA